MLSLLRRFDIILTYFCAETIWKDSTFTDANGRDGPETDSKYIYIYKQMHR